MVTNEKPSDLEIIGRVKSRRGYKGLTRAAKTARWCEKPIQLSQIPERVTLRRTLIDTVSPSGSDFEGIYFKACGTRRRSRCEPCSKLYQGDARQLILAGLAGGKGVPESVAAHPAVFATLTAPSFGPVHRAIRKDGGKLICHPRGGRRCRHGKLLMCCQSHEENDEIIGAPLCKKCYRYKTAVIWNAESTRLWQRTTIYLRRHLAKLLGITEKELSQRVRVSYAKVIEFQRRGVVHLHVVIRLDDSEDHSAPPKLAVSPSQIELALRLAVSRVKVNFEADGKVETIMWGKELNILEVNESSVGKVANYIAKYATKSSCDSNSLDHQVRSEREIRASGAPEHLRKMALTAWELGHNAAYSDLNLSMWAHDLGHRGHFLTKSRRYSVTFSYLARLRQIWQEERRSELRIAADEAFKEGKTWHFMGRGWLFPSDRYLVAQERLQREETKQFMKDWFEQDLQAMAV